MAEKKRKPDSSTNFSEKLRRTRDSEKEILRLLQQDEAPVKPKSPNTNKKRQDR